MPASNAGVIDEDAECNGAEKKSEARKKKDYCVPYLIELLNYAAKVHKTPDAHKRQVLFL